MDPNMPGMAGMGPMPGMPGTGPPPFCTGKTSMFNGFTTVRKATAEVSGGGVVEVDNAQSFIMWACIAVLGGGDSGAWGHLPGVPLRQRGA
jgi:hypothetical protein